MTQATLRPARRDEGAALSALAFMAKAALGYSAQQMQAWRDDLCIDPEQGPTWVAEQDGDLVGVVAWRGTGLTLDLTDLWVRPGCQRSGLGRRLLAHALEGARQAGATRMTIDAEPSAAPFYQRCGAVLCRWRPAPIDGQPSRQRPQFDVDLNAQPDPRDRVQPVSSG